MIERLWKEVQQWRNCYLLLLLMFGFVCLLGGGLLPRLENTRFGGGLHPIDVWILMKVLGTLWMPLLLCALLFFLSFYSKPLNTPAAVAVTALCFVAILVLVASAALLRISISTP